MKLIATGQITIRLVSDTATARLSSDIHAIPTDANGENGDYTGASTTLTILDGSTDETSKWNIIIEEGSVGSFATVEGLRSGATYTVTKLLAESAIVKFTATREDYSDIVKEFKVFKNRQGVAGEDARNYYLSTDVSNIKQLKDGSFIPSNIEFQGKLRAGSKFPVDYLGYFVIYEQSRNSITIDDYTNLAEQGLIAPDSEYIVSDLAYPYVERYASTEPESYVLYDYKANPNMLLIEFYDDIERSVLLDVKTIPIVIDGSNAYNMYVMPSDGIVFKFDKDGNSIGISSTTLTANVTNVENVSFVWEKNGVVVIGNTTNTLSVNNSDLTGVDSITYKCTISGEANGIMVELSDTVTVIKTKDGLNGLPAYSIGLTNETVNISTESNGTGYDLANARTGVILYLGTTRKTGSIGTITASGCTAQTDGVTMWLTGIDSGVNDGYVDIQIKDGATIIGVKRFTFSKNRKGEQGATGNTGADGITYYNWYKYADSADGTIGMDDSPTGKRFLGIAMNQESPTESTDPALYTWSPLYDNVSVGGRNLILNSDMAVSSSSYLVKLYTMSENFITGETYTVSIKGAVNSGQSFGVWQNGGSTGKGNLIYNATKGVHTLTFQASATTSGNERKISVYNVGATVSSANIEWIQLEKGNVNTSYVRAPEDIKAEIDGVQSAVDTINDTTLPALEDGLLNKAEKESVRQSLNVVGAEKSGIDTQYNAIYANPFIIGTQERTNLLNAKDSYNNAYQNLVNAIDVVLNVADGTRITSIQVSAVTTRFGEYGTAISTYRTMVEKALDIISARKVSAGIDGIVVSGRNMLQGTSATLETVEFSGWDYYLPNNLIGWEKNKPIVGKIWLEPVSYDASCMIHFRYTDSSYLQARGSVISAGASGYSIISTTVPNRDDISYIQFSIRHSAETTPLNEVRYKEAKVEMGTTPTGWSQAPEDVVDVVIGIDSRLKNAESAITEEAITNTVMSTTKFSAKLAEYAKGEELAGYATTDALGAVKGEVDLAKKAIEDLDLTPYVTSTQMEQLEDSINNRVSQSGGVNMLRNSIGWNGVDFWNIVTGAPITIQTPELETFGFGSGWHKKHGTTATKITQTVNLPIAGTYTISFKMNKNTETAVAGKYSACGVYVDNLPLYGEGTGSGTTSGFEDYSLTFTTTKLTADISIVIGELAEATISGVMLNLGSFPLQWTSHGSEVYNTNVRVDINGIQVMGNRSGKRTVINTDEFAGYENNEKVFTVNGETTEVKKLKAERQFEMAPITIITIDNASYKGWAFI